MRTHKDRIDELEDRAIHIRWQNIIGLAVVNLGCWHGVTTHATTLQTWFWVLTLTVLILCRDLYTTVYELRDV